MRTIRITRLTSGCEVIDDLLGGGFENGVVTQLFGAPGTGKTNICLQLIIECVKGGKKVVFIDSEGFSPERFEQIAGSDALDIAKNVVVYEPISLDQQYSNIKELDNIVKENVGLIVLDSATTFYRLALENGDNMSLRRVLANQVAHLHRIARNYSIVVVITNQVYTDVGSNELCAVGGTMIEHLSKTIIQLEHVGTGRRRATIRKHRSRPEGVSCEFLITQQGVQ
ncbi:MAG: DNA repair and recombination protein RadB [Methanosarcinales archaeon]|nr:MAG: DNA repair and recombination protein RadB [Methanosarcinales archaeon]